MVFGGSIRFSTADFRSCEYPKSSSYPAHLRNRGKVERRTTSLTQGETAATDVEDDVKMETGPFHRSHQLGVRRYKLSPGQFDPGNAGPRLTPGTRPDWALRPAVRAFGRLDGGAGGVVPQPPHGRRGSDTSCGSNIDRCLHRAVSRRPRSGSGRQSAGSADEQVPDRVRFPARLVKTAHAPTVPAVFPPEVALSAPHDADAQRRATPPVPRRWPPSDGCPGSKPQPSPSRFAAVAGRLLHLVQQGSHFFLDGDDRPRLIEAPGFKSGRKAAFSRLALASSACKGLAAAFCGINGGVKSGHWAARNSATLGLGVTRATRGRPGSSALHIAGG